MSLINSFNPAQGSSFVVLVASDITGQFANTSLPPGFRVVYGSTTVSISNACPADFNADGVADFFDYLDFVSAFAATSPSADFNADGVVDFFDYLDFVAAFAAGC